MSFFSVPLVPGILRCRLTPHEKNAILSRLLLATAIFAAHIDSQPESVQEELGKEQEITKVHDQNSGIVLKLSPTVFPVYQGESPNGNNTSHHHLQDLCHCDVLWSEPFGFHLDGHQKVVKVHDRVNSIVNCCVNDSSRSVGDHSMPGAK